MQRALPPFVRLAALGAFVLAAGACPGPGSDGPPRETARAVPPTPPATSAGQQTPDAGGQVITVRMVTGSDGSNAFVPANFEAKRGDVIRYTLESGIHNVHFVADSNPGRPGLPGPSEIFQNPGQTYDVKVSWEPGSYYYQCDPHALLGMVGRVTVR